MKGFAAIFCNLYSGNLRASIYVGYLSFEDSLFSTARRGINRLDWKTPHELKNDAGVKKCKTGNSIKLSQKITITTMNN